MNEWNCPHCGEYYCKSNQPYEEYTVGTFTGVPHIICPKCNKCMGCLISEAKACEEVLFSPEK